MRFVAVGACVVVLVDAPVSSTILIISAAEPGGDGRDFVGSDERRSWRRCRRRRPHAELAHAWVRAAARLHVVARCRAARCLVVHAAVVVLFGAALAAIRVPLPVPHLLHRLAVLAVVVGLAARFAVLRQPVADPEVDVALRVGMCDDASTAAIAARRSASVTGTTRCAAALRATHAACISSYVPVVLVTHRLRPGGKDGGEGGLGGERGGDGSDGGGGAIPSHRPPNRAVAQVQLQAIHVSEVEKTRHP